MIRNWLIKCDEEHSHLPGPGSSGSRILHIIGLGLLRVINTSTGDIETLSVLTDFVALSYVWGREREPDQSLKALPIMDYAATIRDAATLAQSLGFDWLWVDRICIDQSNDSEKAVLIPYIKDIFASATLTLVAASGNGAHFGLPGSPHTAREGEKPLKLDPQTETGGDVLQLLAEQPSFNTLLNGSVWHTRGWTFEEEVFSRRLLYIFPTEIFFSCNKGTYRESTVNKFVPEPAGSTWADFGATPPLITAELNAVMQQRRSRSSSKLFSTRQFVRAVEEYTSRDLTIEEDRVEAFAGLVTAATHLGDKNLEESLLKHGHPFGFFETALTWHPETDTPKRNPAHGKPFVPSWSWASAGSKVRFLDSGEEENKSNWFQYGSIENQDILGLPSSETLLSTRLGLDFPTQLIASRPWLEQVSSGSLPSYLEAIAAPAIATPAVISSRSSVLPTLHLDS
ncbi:hypothetical protein E8E14_003553 [Neopestalotiopsis sp. 37M]|nr:hypothetical protein E8E14_003553 [Neopestalotiopsis sp. 37M]